MVSSTGDQSSPLRVQAHGAPDLNKPVPPTPVHEPSRGRALSRSRSDLSSTRWQPRAASYLDGPPSQQPQLAVLTESLPPQPYPDIMSAESDPGLDLAPFRARRSDHKIGQILGYGDAQAYEYRQILIPCTTDRYPSVITKLRMPKRLCRGIFVQAIQTSN